MTARTTHFDFHAEGLEAFCGTPSRIAGQAPELSERRKDVTCKKCLKMMDEIRQLEDEAILAGDDDNAVEFDFEATFSDQSPEEHEEITQSFVAKLGVPAQNLEFYQAIADRHGLAGSDVMDGFIAGYLKR